MLKGWFVGGDGVFFVVANADKEVVEEGEPLGNVEIAGDGIDVEAIFFGESFPLGVGKDLFEGDFVIVYI